MINVYVRYCVCFANINKTKNKIPQTLRRRETASSPKNRVIIIIFITITTRRCAKHHQYTGLQSNLFNSSGKPPLKSTVYLVQYFISTSASTTLSPGLKGLLAPFPGGSVVCVYVVRVYSESFCHQHSVSSGGQGHRTE